MKTSQQQSIIYSILASTIVCTFFIGFNYLQAQWSGAPNNPPSNNIAAPIHTGSGIQSKGSAPGDRIGSGMFIAGVEMRSNRYCDVNGNNCFGSDDVYDTLSLNGAGARFYYQRRGGPVGQTAEHVPYPPNGGDWDFCVVSGNRLFDAGNIWPRDYDISPEEWPNHDKHPSTVYRSVSGGSSCSVFRGGGSMRDFDGNQLPGGRWTILLAETDPGLVARCIATCYKRTID